MDPLYLRNATAAEHERVEATVPLMGAGLDLATYVGTLRRFYGFVKGWEEWAACHVPPAFENEFQQRRRSPMLQQDLSFFREPLPEQTFRPGIVVNGSAGAFLGSMYVLEGSTLGGQMIATHVEKTLRLKRGEGDAYFVGHGEQTGAMWRRFKSLLLSVPEEQADDAVAAARQTFTDFGAWMSSGTLPQPHIESPRAAHE